MRFTRLNGTLLACGALGVLLGTGGPQRAIAAPGAMVQRSAIPPFSASAARSAVPDAVSKELLYVIGTEPSLDVIGTEPSLDDPVYVLTYPGLKPVETLGAIFAPQDSCVDKDGDVFFTSWDGKGAIIEYAHGGSSPIRTLRDPDGSPLSCATDPTSGDLAVTNTTGYPHGNVVIYRHARGKPTRYSDPTIDVYDFAAYDERGNLYIDGHRKGGAPAYAELPAGSSTFTDIVLDHNIGRSPTHLQWEGTYLAIATQFGSVVYHVAVSGSKGKIVGTTSLGECSAIDLVIFGDKLLALCGGSLVTFPYPAGAPPLRISQKIESLFPIGIALSR